MEKERHIRIFDTTLRDGEQSPGVALSLDQKLEIAQALAQLNVDIIEAGFPVSGPMEFEAVRRIATEVKGPIIAALARTHTLDIDQAAKALEKAEKPRIHVFTSASKVHLQYMLRKTEEEVLEMADRMVRYARRYVDDVEFSAQDVMRADWEFVKRLYEVAIEAGATTINIPDTTGYGTPQEYGALIRRIRDEVVRGGTWSSPPTPTTTWAWPRPTPWRAWRTGRARLSAPSTASGSGRGTAPWRRWSWPSTSAGTGTRPTRGSTPGRSTG